MPIVPPTAADIGSDPERKTAWIPPAGQIHAVIAESG